jgi:hypothetical protein
MRARFKVSAVIIISLLVLTTNYTLLEWRHYESIRELKPVPQAELEMRVAALRATTQPATRPAVPRKMEDGF